MLTKPNLFSRNSRRAFSARTVTLLVVGLTTVEDMLRKGASRVSFVLYC